MKIQLDYILIQYLIVIIFIFRIFEFAYIQQNPFKTSFSQVYMNESNSYNRFSSDLIIVYTKEGGFVGIKQKIFYDSFTKELTFINERNNTFRVSKLTDNEEKELTSEIIADKVMNSDQNYPPKEGSADFFSYGLFIILTNKSHSVKWTDASGPFPEGLSKFATFIENLKPSQ